MKITEAPVAESSVDLLEVVEVKQVGLYKLAITFATGEQQLVDFEPFLRRATHPAVQAYLDEGRFRQFKIVHGNLNWNDYDLIFPVADLFSGAI